MNDNRPVILGGDPLRDQGPPKWPPEDPAVREVLRSAASDGSWGRYHGPHCRRLDESLTDLHEGGQTILCCSGTAAVELALRGMKVGLGDEVILSAYDFKGNFQDVIAIGAVPALVDISPANAAIDVSKLDAAWTEKTRAIVASHLHGGIVDMPALMEFARSRGIPVIEDVCQCPGARVHGRTAGNWGDVAVHSFGGSKLVTAGRGGALVTSNPEIAQRVRLYTQRGNDAYPLSELQAAILLPQLLQLRDRNSQRARQAGRLIDALRSGTQGVTPFLNPPSDSLPGYYKLGLFYEASAFEGMSRELFVAAVRAEGVALSTGFRALHQSHSRRRFRTDSDLPVSTRADERLLTLHHPILLEDDAAVDLVISAIVRIREHAGAIIAAASQNATLREFESFKMDDLGE